MEFSLTQIFLIFVVSCFIGMDSILDEFQLHRPIVACTLIGLILGNISTGIVIGGTLEMISLGWMNVGASIAPDTALASIISSILVIVGKQDIGTGIAVSIPIAAA
ncbi:PTS sugar transporter subunit IIC, partial [Candidatus Riesia pediculischaeffi]